MSANGVSAPLIITPLALATWRAAPSWNLGLIMSFSPGAQLVATVLVTGDPSAVTGNLEALYTPHDILSNISANTNSNVEYPIVGLKLLVDSYVSGEVNLGIAQWP